MCLSIVLYARTTYSYIWYTELIHRFVKYLLFLYSDFSTDLVQRMFETLLIRLFCSEKSSPVWFVLIDRSKRIGRALEIYILWSSIINETFSGTLPNFQIPENCLYYCEYCKQKKKIILVRLTHSLF